MPLRFLRQFLRRRWALPRTELALVFVGLAVSTLLLASVVVDPAPSMILVLLLHLSTIGVFVYSSIRSDRQQAGPIQEDNPSLENHLGTVKAIALAMEARDSYTQGHCLRVRYLTRRILDRLGTTLEARAPVEAAALLHDVGKIGTPDSILLKAGRLTKAEYARLMLHVELGVEIIEPLDGLSEVATIVKHHHERVDGTGYPDGLKGDEIPFGSRVIAVADTIDAMRSARPYRSAMSLEDAIAELRRARGCQLDPEIVDAAISILDRGKRTVQPKPEVQPELETMTA